MHPQHERQLFLDDVDIDAKIENLTRTMHQPAKKGCGHSPRSFHARDQRPDPHGSDLASPKKALASCGICAASPKDLHAEGRAASGYYESKDGLHWTKAGWSAWSNIDFGSKENNYVNHLMGPIRSNRLRIIGWTASSVMIR